MHVRVLELKYLGFESGTNEVNIKEGNEQRC